MVVGTSVSWPLFGVLFLCFFLCLFVGWLFGCGVVWLVWFVGLVGGLVGWLVGWLVVVVNSQHVVHTPTSMLHGFNRALESTLTQHTVNTCATDKRLQAVQQSFNNLSCH